MIVLGIHIEECATAALMIDGKMVACASEERFSRKKNDERYPRQAIDYCLREAGIQGSDIDVVAVPGQSLLFSTWVTRHFSTWSIQDHVRAQHEYWRPRLYEGKDVRWIEVFADKLDLDQFPGTFRDLLAMEKDYYGDDLWERLKKDVHKGIAEHLGIDPARIRHVDHHACHSAYAYWSSPFRDEPVLVVTADAWGDDVSATLALARGNRIERFHEVPANTFRLARLYRYITLLLGMKPNEHEYKVMGMAPYAKPQICEQPYRVFRDTMYVDGLDFGWKENPKDMYFYFRDRLEGCRFDGIAGALQRYTEEILCEWIANAVRHTGVRKVVFSGGISMNIKANQAIAALPEIEALFVGGSGSDESTALGACCHVAAEHIADKGGDPAAIEFLGLNLGPSFTPEFVKNWAVEKRLGERFDIEEGTTPARVAEVLDGGSVIGRLAGRMEFGSRALGNRSIIADPRRRETIDKVNHKIKSRDFWMPFAPSILEEAADRYAVNPKGLLSPFMTIGFDSTPLARAEIPATLHPSDHTMRPQMVRQSHNPGYHAILSAFEGRTGVGGVLNTSFNLHGDPIVCDPDDALYVFENSDLDAILLEDTMVYKRTS